MDLQSATDRNAQTLFLTEMIRGKLNWNFSCFCAVIGQYQSPALLHNNPQVPNWKSQTKFMLFEVEHYLSIYVWKIFSAELLARILEGGWQGISGSHTLFSQFPSFHSSSHVFVLWLCKIWHCTVNFWSFSSNFLPLYKYHFTHNVWFQKISIPLPRREFHLGSPSSPDFPFFEVSYNPSPHPSGFSTVWQHPPTLWKISFKKGEC